MPKAYRTKRDLSVPLVISRFDTDEDNPETSGETFPAGSVIPASRMTKHHRDQVENGHLDHLLEPIDDDEEAESALMAQEAQSDFGVFVPEHEAERMALRVYGHTTVPREQELEALSASEQYHSEHMARVKEEGRDRRPVQEHLANSEQRVPDQLLTGAETRTGLPHNQGVAEQEFGAEEHEDAAEAPTTRSRPSLAPRAEAEEAHADDEPVADESQED